MTIRNISSSVGVFIATKLRELGKTQLWLARKTSITHSTLGMITAGYREPNINWILKNGPSLAKALQISFQDILDHYDLRSRTEVMMFVGDTLFTVPMLQAVIELKCPTLGMLNKLRKCQMTMGIELDSDTCKALLVNFQKKARSV